MTETPTRERLPLSALLTLAGTVFLVVSGEMMPTAVLPELAADLEVSLAQAGLLVSAWAMTVVIASFPLARATARLPRAHVEAGALAVFSVATLVTASAPSYEVALASRLVAAAATGLLWSTVNAHAASIVPEHRIARATAIVLGGGTLGTIGGIPAGNAMAQAWGWQAPFLLLGVLGLLGAAAVLALLRTVPLIAPTPSDHPSGQPAGRARSLGPVLGVAALGGLILVAHFAVFTFVAELLTPSALPTPALLLLFGVVSAVGVAAVGVSSDRHPTATPAVTAGMMAAALAAVTVVGRHAGADLALVLVWGTVTGAVGPAVQVALMRAAGPQHRSTAGTLMPVAMNFGIAVGAALGSGVVERWSLDVLPLVSIVPAVLAAAGFAALGRRRPPSPEAARPTPAVEPASCRP
ncbi:MFS transporter [Georgenia deserti]|uniref:MFS transporter n=1 Tax=Georgenia deserti TaxID=2093781 RepID=A0ABW4L9S9_9MICO